MNYLGGKKWPVIGGLAVGAVLIVASMMSSEPPSRPIPDDPMLRSQYIGKTVLVGVRELARDGKPKQQMEWVGHIVRLSAQEGIVLELEDGPPCILPPDLEPLVPAAPGEYQLHSSGRTVADPDFETTWEYIDHLDAGTGRIAPPTWSPDWRSRSFLASRAYRVILAARRWLKGSAL